MVGQLYSIFDDTESLIVRFNFLDRAIGRIHPGNRREGYIRSSDKTQQAPLSRFLPKFGRSERGILDRLAFKGGTCLRKMFIGAQGRFSTYLDFTGTEEHDHEDLILDMMEAFDQPYHGIHFPIPDEGLLRNAGGPVLGCQSDILA
jgi:Nucleotidyl transferase AbiEii toxin, Type IV TA system